jgi:hypothetical protein
MPYTDVYLGSLAAGADPLDWGGDNRPVAFRPYKDTNYVFFPPARPAPAFFSLLGKIKSGQFPSRQLDWGCWAAKVSKQDIVDFIDEVYSGKPASNDEWRLRLDELIAFVNALPDEDFAMVAIEM